MKKVNIGNDILKGIKKIVMKKDGKDIAKVDLSKLEQPLDELVINSKIIQYDPEVQAYKNSNIQEAHDSLKKIRKMINNQDL